MYQWDTAGQERYRTITSSYYKGAHGIIVVYDITNRSSFEGVKHWMKEISKRASFEIQKILVGNKADLHIKRNVVYAEGAKAAEKYGASFMEVSAKDSINVEKLFLDITKKVVANKKISNSKGGKQLKNQGSNKSNNSCC